MFSDNELAYKMRDLQKHYHSSVLNASLYYDVALDKISKILLNVTQHQLQKHKPNEIIPCMIKILFHYDENTADEVNLCEWKRQRKIQYARLCYYKLLDIFIPKVVQDVVTIVIDVIYEDKWWEFETFCFKIIYDLIEHGASGAIIVNKIWEKIESINTNILDIRKIIRILYEILNVYKWPETEDTIIVVERILKAFYTCIWNMNSANTSNFCIILRKGMEVCIRNIAKNLSNDHLLIIIYHMCSWTIEENTMDNIILEFSSTLEYVAYLHCATLYEKTLIPRIFSLLMCMIASNSKIVSLLGNRVLQHLIDRKSNRLYFDTPKLFFEDTYLAIKIKYVQKEDKLFLKKYRKILHDSLLKSILNHCNYRINLETTYCTICLIAIEVPSGFTAAALACFIMNLQDLILQQSNYRDEINYHIHATVISIMSLLCWIHKAEVFYAYVNTIMMERAQWAPHLNPPIQNQYNFAMHHILWNKRELFFVDWEVRYGLWKCFRFQERLSTIIEYDQ